MRYFADKASLLPTRVIASNFALGRNLSEGFCRDSLLAVRHVGRASARPYRVWDFG
jgi:hypothetical protein